MSEKENSNIPTLRFSEFKNATAWQVKTLGEVAKFRRGSFPQPYNLSKWYDNANGIPFVQVCDFTDNLKLKSKTKRRISKLAESKSVFAKKGSVILTIQGTIGNIAIAQYDAYIDRTLLMFQSVNRKLNKIFFVYAVCILFAKEKKNAVGVTIKSITKKKLRDFVINFPSLPEQRKIAGCLSSLDDLIIAQSDKLDALKIHKEGLIQKLFPQKNQTTPSLRFSEFENSPEWQLKILDNVAKFYKGKGISKSDIVENGKIPCIRYGELYTQYSEFIDEIKSFTNLPLDDLVMSLANDVIIPASGERKKDITKVSCVMIKDVALGGDLSIIRSRNNGVFLSYYLNNAKKADIEKMAQGVSIKHLYVDSLKSLEISLPRIPEQKKIAGCLLSLDNLITAQSEKLDALKIHKKGLIQQLFPVID